MPNWVWVNAPRAPEGIPLSLAAQNRTPAFILLTAASPAVAARGWKASGCFSTGSWRSHFLGSLLWPFAPEGEWSPPFALCPGQPAGPGPELEALGLARLLLPGGREQVGCPGWLRHQLGPSAQLQEPPAHTHRIYKHRTYKHLFWAPSTQSPDSCRCKSPNPSFLGSEVECCVEGMNPEARIWVERALQPPRSDHIEIPRLTHPGSPNLGASRLQ